MNRLETEGARRIARDVLAGDLDLLAGCRQILRYRRTLDIRNDSAWDVIAAVESETDDFPVGSVREAWDPDTLASKDLELTAYLERVGPMVRKAFEDIEKALEVRSEGV
jgi:hypothetical protein